MSAKYTLRVRCASWDGLESFYCDRIRPGALLGARVPFVPQRGDQVTVALELPDGIVVAIDSVVRELGDTVDGKTPIMLRLVGFDDAMIFRLTRMVELGRAAEIKAQKERVNLVPRPARARRVHARPPLPTPEDAPIDVALAPFVPPDAGGLEGEALALFEQLTAEMARLRELGARAVIGTDESADAEEVRAAYFELVRKYHPDALARHNQPALTHAASELSIFINRAYDRVRSAVRAAGGKSVAGPAMRPELGWLIDIGDIEMASQPAASREGELSEGFRVRVGSKPAPAPATRPVTRSVTRPVTRSRTRSAPLTAEGLFDDVTEDSDPGGAAIVDRTLEDEPGAQEGENLSELIAQAASAAERGDLDSASQLYADALNIDPRDRKLRARYHATRGRQLLAEGDSVRATMQLELALTHDPSSADAKRSLAGLQSGSGRKRRFSGWFKR